MEQKEAELDKEHTAPEETPEVLPTGALSEQEEEGQPDSGQDLLPLASGVGRRVRHRPAGSLARIDPDSTGVEESDLDSSTDLRLAGWGPAASTGLARGGLAAVVLLLIFVPTVIFLLYQLYAATERIDAMRDNLATFSNNNTNENAQTNETALIALLNRPNLKIYPMVVENLSPTGRIVIYTTGKDLALTYGNLDPLSPGQFYAIWLSNKPAGNPEAVFTRLGAIPNDNSQARALVVKPASLPANFNLANYAEVSVTLEPTDQAGNKPVGPRVFSLDLTPLKGQG